MTMKIVIQDAVTGYFFREPNRWTRTPQHALAFSDGVGARSFILRHALAHVAVVFLPENLPYHRPVPVAE